MGEQLEIHWPVGPQPQLWELGWEPVRGGGYVHESGATIDRRAYLSDDQTRMVFEARVNGGDWYETSEKFWETLERARREHG